MKLCVNDEMLFWLLGQHSLFNIPVIATTSTGEINWDSPVNQHTSNSFLYNICGQVLFCLRMRIQNDYGIYDLRGSYCHTDIGTKSEPFVLLVTVCWASFPVDWLRHDVSFSCKCWMCKPRCLILLVVKCYFCTTQMPQWGTLW